MIANAGVVFFSTLAGVSIVSGQINGFEIAAFTGGVQAAIVFFTEMKLESEDGDSLLDHAQSVAKHTLLF